MSKDLNVAWPFPFFEDLQGLAPREEGDATPASAGIANHDPDESQRRDGHPGVREDLSRAALMRMLIIENLPDCAQPIFPHWHA